MKVVFNIVNVLAVFEKFVHFTLSKENIDEQFPHQEKMLEQSLKASVLFLYKGYFISFDYSKGSNWASGPD